MLVALKSVADVLKSFLVYSKQNFFFFSLCAFFSEKPLSSGCKEPKNRG